LAAGDVWSAVTLKYGQGATTILNVPPASAGDVPANITAALLGFQDLHNAGVSRTGSKKESRNGASLDCEKGRVFTF
jgi:hypothetical protein